MKNHWFKSLIGACALFLHLAASAEDIDLFVGAPPTASDVPNVLIILDNTANWNNAFTNEMASLVSIFNNLPANKFRVGLMLFSETGGGNSGNDGGYVRAAVRMLDPATKTKYAALINGLSKLGDKSNGGKAGKAMEEAYLYLTGGVPYAGNNKVKADYAGNPYWVGFPGNALASAGATQYISPIAATSCAKTYIIFISNGPSQDNATDTTQATAALAAAGGNTTVIPLNPSGSQDNVSDEWARFFKTSSLKASVYTLDIDKVTSGQGPGWSAVLKSMAGESGGKYYDVTSSGSQVVDALNNIFSEIQSVNSVFASVSLPVSVNTQGTYLNQVYVGMFRPDPDANPRWAGNLKQYKLGMVSGSLKLQDADSVGAINNQTGFIAECARSYWTPSAVDTEWTLRPGGDCLTVGNSFSSNYPDGNVVEKGGEAYKLRGSGTGSFTRTVKTCIAPCTSVSNFVNFDTTNITQAMLGAATSTERDQLVNWSVGSDIDDNDPANGNTTAARLSVHGDVVHSRPVAINFGTDTAPNVVVFYGGNDGILRAINGNRANAIGTIPAGGELWSFMPAEFYTSIKRLRANTPLLLYPYMTTLGGTVPLRKNYGTDGPITAFKGTVGGVSKAFVYATLRRGGRALYAFDVSNSVTAPSSPTFKWKLGCPNASDDIGCSTGMSGLGQTWSSPKPMTASGYGSTPLLIMGGGYDTCDDFDGGVTGANNNCTSISKGHYVYVINADTGAVVKTFDTGENRGVIADVTIVRDAAGNAIYGYTADLGGNVYRISFSGGTVGDASGWSMTKSASLGCDNTGSCVGNRKFMFAPSVVAVGSDYVVMLGSGDREKPLTYYAATTAVTNYFFMFTDKPTNPSWGDCGGNVICKTSLLGITGTTAPTATDLAAKKGWYLGMTSTEQVVTSAITIFGVVTFSTHQPAVPVSGSCGNLGTARVYNVSYLDASSANGTSSRYGDLAGDGLPPSPVAGQVELENGSIVPFCIGCSKDSPLEGSTPQPLATVIQPKGRLYWYLQK